MVEKSYQPEKGMIVQDYYQLKHTLENSGLNEDMWPPEMRDTLYWTSVKLSIAPPEEVFDKLRRVIKNPDLNNRERSQIRRHIAELKRLR